MSPSFALRKAKGTKLYSIYIVIRIGILPMQIGVVGPSATLYTMLIGLIVFKKNKPDIFKWELWPKNNNFELHTGKIYVV